MQEVINYIKKIKPFIYGSSVIFALSFVFGFVLIYINPETISSLFDDLAELASIITSMSDWEMALFIFLNNSIKISFSALLGVFFGVFPVFFLFTNGLLLGAVSYHSYYEQGIGFLAAGLLPHGIFEIPAAIIAASIGLMLGKKVAENVFKDKEHNIKKEVKLASMFILKFLVPLVFIAAIVEVFLTFHLVS